MEARDDEREALRSDIADEISGVAVGTGYESTTIGITAALEAADLLIAAGYRKHPEPEITEEMVRRGALAMCRMDWKISMGGATTLVKAALEAAFRGPDGEEKQP